MTYPATNDKVSIVFTGTLDNGEVFMTVDESDPFSVTIGNHELPPTLEQTVTQMQPGQTEKVRVAPEEGYGHRQKDLVQVIDNQQMVDNLKPIPGMILSLKISKDGQDQSVPATVMEVDGSKITVDYNHPLAGHHLNYEVTLLAIDKNSN